MAQPGSDLGVWSPGQEQVALSEGVADKGCDARNIGHCGSKEEVLD